MFDATAAATAVTDPAAFFAAAFVISLQRTPDRLAAFRQSFPGDWPFAVPEHFPAHDGMAGPPPRYFTEGGPAYGCLQSHLGIAKKAVAARYDKPVLVLEDDCGFVGDAGRRLAELLPRVPGDADLFYVGCQIRHPCSTAAEGVVRADVGAQRTHAYVLYPRFFRRMVSLLTQCSVHIDWRLEELTRAGKITCYAASPVLAIQRAGWSTIRYKDVPAESWDSRVPVPRGVVKKGGEKGGEP